MKPDKKAAWQLALMNAVTDPKELLELLELDLGFVPKAIAASRLFPLKVPREFITRMQKKNLNDPLLNQILPIAAELHDVIGYVKDPLGEKSVNPIPGLLHKYHGRVLLTLTSACAVNCRFCFRRHFPYAENNPGRQGWDPILKYIAENQTISEIILSGGDPLVMNDSMLNDFILQLTHIRHVKRLRIHTRMPIVLPERVTSELLQAIIHPQLKTIVVVHCNHPQEINQLVLEAIRLFINSGITVLNQSLLLKNINDNVITLMNLSEILFETGILPYYLHLLDKVQGAAHFDIPISVAKHLHAQIKKRLPGYLVPKLVFEQAGAPAKSEVYFPEFCTD